jgi:hypothetical protein
VIFQSIMAGHFVNSYFMGCDCSVLGPILNMPITESKRQRVLVASSILYSEVTFFCIIELSV